MPHLLLVMLGGALGSGARYLTGRAALVWMGPNFPWGTLAVNLIGGFAMGVLTGVLVRTGQAGGVSWYLLGVGVLGGFTTFSAFSLDTINLIERGDFMLATTYILASVIGSVAALAIGLNAVRAIA
ncbi:MAG: fluoride efflux transporter CrcB [Sphingomonas sp.]|uniref:fluoride efflux transporter CrcB n=1 Tax=Sphingomonas sp. TaxID=28214 RepID=UPI0025E26AC9|nr:fluoride efflux transporter CrcB [Sphingomonas sp.]MBX3566267.1 fluoride efflux transporter CrcB [Sphingomonas sp.]